ncbi:MAG: hypothetical protein QXI12_07145 [Candidatus Methanomethyliaceae archaeon]
MPSYALYINQRYDAILRWETASSSEVPGRISVSTSLKIEGTLVAAKEEKSAGTFAGLGFVGAFTTILSEKAESGDLKA